MKNDYCVYIHFDKNNFIRYVGSGTIDRANKTYPNSNRGLKYKNFVEEFGKLNVKIIYENLTKSEAIRLETILYEKHSQSLLNTNRPSPIKILPEISELSKILYYDETSKSCLRWKIDVKNAKTGSEAGYKNKYGYWQIGVNGKIYKGHRIVATLCGMILNSEQIVDHIDNDRSNNKIKNLRIVTHSENSRNLSFNKIKDFPIGVTFSLRQNSFVASVTDPFNKNKLGKNKTLSKYFSLKKYSYEEALCLAIKARQDMLKEIEIKWSINYSDSHKYF